jgi:hypothetical protein
MPLTMQIDNARLVATRGGQAVTLRERQTRDEPQISMRRSKRQAGRARQRWSAWAPEPEPGTLLAWTRVIRAKAAKQMLTSMPALVTTTVLRWNQRRMHRPLGSKLIENQLTEHLSYRSSSHG